MTDRVEALRQATQARHAATVRQAEDTLRAFIQRGDPVTFSRLAHAAKVSRSWLYSQPELRAQIERHRQPTPAREPSRRQSQPATDESLRQQLHTYREEIGRLRTENRVLNDQLARHLGVQRADNVTGR
jgi:hypothetical protein